MLNTHLHPHTGQALNGTGRNSDRIDAAWPEAMFQAPEDLREQVFGTGAAVALLAPDDRVEWSDTTSVPPRKPVPAAGRNIRKRA